MEIKGGYVAVLAVLVACEGVDAVRSAVGDGLWRLKGGIWDEGSVVFELER